MFIGACETPQGLRQDTRIAPGLPIRPLGIATLRLIVAVIFRRPHTSVDCRPPRRQIPLA